MQECMHLCTHTKVKEVTQEAGSSINFRGLASLIHKASGHSIQGGSGLQNVGPLPSFQALIHISHPKLTGAHPFPQLWECFPPAQKEEECEETSSR